MFLGARHFLHCTKVDSSSTIKKTERALKVSRLTASKYLDVLAEHGFLKQQRIGRTNYYVNAALNRILIGAETGAGTV